MTTGQHVRARTHLGDINGHIPQALRELRQRVRHSATEQWIHEIEEAVPGIPTHQPHVVAAIAVAHGLDLATIRSWRYGKRTIGGSRSARRGEGVTKQPSQRATRAACKRAHTLHCSKFENVRRECTEVKMSIWQANWRTAYMYVQQLQRDAIYWCLVTACHSNTPEAAREFASLDAPNLERAR
jgi:hypothetical protein